MKHIIRLFLLFIALILLTSAAFAIPENYVIRNGDRSVPKVAITVDDGFGHEMIRAIHELSIELDFPITWFMVGYHFWPEEKEIWDDVIARGNEIGNHTWKHSKLMKFSDENVRVQLTKCQERVDEVLGYHYPLRLLRPPYGQYKSGSRNILPLFEKYGVEKVILWDVSQTDPYKAFEDVQNGSILLYHTNQKDYECLKILVPMLKEAGYQLVTVSELLNLEPLELPVETATPRPAMTPAPTAEAAQTAVSDDAAVPAATPAPTAAPTATPTPTAPARTELTKEDVVSNGDRSKKQIAVTVDDCSNVPVLEKIHALSVELDVPVTYFVIGEKFSQQDQALWEDIIAHQSELGNHTWKHSVLTNYSISNGHVQIRKTQERVDEVLGYHYPLRLVRPPRGSYRSGQKNFLPVFEEYGVEKVILWDVAETDPGKAFAAVQNGSILQFHTNEKDYDCLVELIPMLLAEGYELVTVSELLGLEPLALDTPAAGATAMPE